MEEKLTYNQKGCCGMHEDFTFVGADGKRHEMVRQPPTTKVEGL